MKFDIIWPYGSEKMIIDGSQKCETLAEGQRSTLRSED